MPQPSQGQVSTPMRLMVCTFFAFPSFVWWASSSIQTAPVIWTSCTFIFHLLYFCCFWSYKGRTRFLGTLSSSNFNSDWLKSTFNSVSPVSIFLSCIIYSFLSLQELFHVQCADTESTYVGLLNHLFCIVVTCQSEGIVLCFLKRRKQNTFGRYSLWWSTFARAVINF